MPIIRVQAILPVVSEKHEDDAMNVWHFQTTGNWDEGARAEINGDLVDFYDTLRPFYSNKLKNEVRLRHFDLSEPSPRQPVSDETFPLTQIPGSGTSLPSEVATCLSFRAAVTSGVPAARRRGRLYLGPLNINANNVDGRPGVGWRDTIIAAATTFGNLHTGVVLEGQDWCVYSPTDGVARVVQFAYVDDAFDTQRRRGVDPVARTTVDFS